MATKERTVISKELIRQVELLLRGGASGLEAARITNTSSGTISRIKAAGFDASVYKENTENRIAREKAQKVSADVVRTLERMQEEKEVPGQIRMELPEEVNEQTKMMRFQAAQVEKVLRKLETINDTLNMIIRVIRKE